MDTINILVTGANGQLGSELRNIYNKGNTQIKNTINMVSTDIDTLDITNTIFLKKFFSDRSFDFVINCAAYTQVDKAEKEPDLAKLINTACVKGLIDAIKPTNTKFIHISTDYVFDGNNHKPYNEDDKTNPKSVYGKTKADGEKIAMAYKNAVVIRTSWLYSTYGNNFVKTIQRYSKEREELNVVFDQIGTPTYAHDLAQAIFEIINQSVNKNNFVPGMYHYSNEGVCSWYDFARAIANKSYASCKINPIESKDYPTPTHRPFYSVLNKSKIKSTYNLSIPHWEDSLSDYYKS
ncbi:MAG: dTDP-4-dehydrorhamnose reductase [Bacteroidales bacterium]